jgi:hypothetical protein
MTFSLTLSASTFARWRRPPTSFCDGWRTSRTPKLAHSSTRPTYEVVHGQAGMGVELDQILSATDACHDYISTAIHTDEASNDQEREVMRLLQLATLQSFG